MKKYLFLFILFTLSNCGRDNLPKNFLEQPLPVNGSQEKRELNYSKKEVCVEIFENRLKIDSTRHNFFSELRISKGILKGKDNGEWGGKLEFISDDGKTIAIKKGNVKFVFQFNGKIYFIEGLSHLDVNRGELFELKQSKDGFNYSSLLKFEDAPEAICIFENKIYVAGYKDFYVINNFTKKTVFKDAFWSDLYPNSIAIIDETKVFMGIRGGIVKLNLLEKKMKFYKVLEKKPSL